MSTDEPATNSPTLQHETKSIYFNNEEKIENLGVRKRSISPKNRIQNVETANRSK